MKLTRRAFASTVVGGACVALLQPVSPIESIHGLFLSGGGRFGLGAHAGMIRSRGAGSVMRISG